MAMDTAGMVGVPAGEGRVPRIRSSCPRSRQRRSAAPNHEKRTVPAPISRRHLVAGAAWSVPAVVVASAAPAFAASASCPVFRNRQVRQTPGGGADVIINFDPRSITTGMTYAVTVTVTGCNLQGPTQPVPIADNEARFSLIGSGGGTTCQAQVTYTVNPPGGMCGGSFTVGVG